MPYANKKLEWKVGEPGSEAVIERNLRLMDMVFDRLIKKCGNPFCLWPISVMRDANFATPEHGDVCATCHDLYSALTMANTKLLRTNYFRDAHNQWIQENDPNKNKERRKRLGLDGDQNA